MKVSEGDTEFGISLEAPEGEGVIDADEAAAVGLKKVTKKKSGAFQLLGLSSNVLRGVFKCGLRIPTPIQRKSIPRLLQGKDMLMMARTGSGKTGAFVLPMLEKLRMHSTKFGFRALILSPTRELALQTAKFTADFARFMNLRLCLIVGGDSMESQFESLSGVPDIVVATPGRLLHHIASVNLDLKPLEYVVYDEADRLFEMGFAEQIETINSQFSDHVQQVLVSATLPGTVAEFTKAHLRNVEVVRLDTEQKVSDDLSLDFFYVRNEEKAGALLHLCRNIIPAGQPTIIFTATRYHVDFLQTALEEFGIKSVTAYGTMDPHARKGAVALFRSKAVQFLIITDIAARGIDIPLLDNVVNYNLPGNVKLFVHRVGRAARAGRSGKAFCLVSRDEVPFMLDLFAFLGLPEDGGRARTGCFPQPLVDGCVEEIRQATKRIVELESAEVAMNNGNKHYLRTRGLASGRGAHRAKKIDMGVLHPLFKENPEQARLNMLSQLRDFRPTNAKGERSGKKAIRKTSKSSKRRKTTAVSGDDMKVDALESESDFYMSYTQDATRVRRFKDEESLALNSKKRPVSDSRELFTGGLVMDVTGDESKEMLGSLRKKSTWDRKRKRYVNVDPNADKPTFYVSEGGVKLRGPKKGGDGKEKDNPYEEWKKKTRKEIPRAGTEEEATRQVRQDNRAIVRKARNARTRGGMQSTESGMPRDADKNVRTELKTASEVRKGRKVGERNKILQMSKNDRRAYMESLKRGGQTAKSGPKSYTGKKPRVFKGKGKFTGGAKGK